MSKIFDMTGPALESHALRVVDRVGGKINFALALSIVLDELGVHSDLVYGQVATAIQGLVCDEKLNMTWFDTEVDGKRRRVFTLYLTEVGREHLRRSRRAQPATMSILNSKITPC